MLVPVVLRPFLLGTALLLGCGRSVDALASLDPAEAKALDLLLSEAGLDRTALEGKTPTVSVSVAQGHINRLVLNRPPSSPSLRTLAAFGELESVELIRAVPSLESLPEDCTWVELRMADNGLTDLSPLRRCGSLERLWIVREGLDSLKTLPALPRLKALYVDHVALRSLEGVGGHPELETLFVTHAGLTSLEGLSDLPSLTTLNLSDNALADASALDGFGTLREVDVADNALSSFPEVALAAEVPKIGGNPGADAVMNARFEAKLQAESEKRMAERKVDLGHVVPRVDGTARGVSNAVSWFGNEVTGQGGMERLEGVFKVVLREYDVLELTQVKRRPVDRRMTFTVKQGRVRVYFGHGPGTAASVLVEPGTPRVVETGLAWGDRWTGFIVEAVDGEAEGFGYVLQEP